MPAPRLPLRAAARHARPPPRLPLRRTVMPLPRLPLCAEPQPPDPPGPRLAFPFTLQQPSRGNAPTNLEVVAMAPDLAMACMIFVIRFGNGVADLETARSMSPIWKARSRSSNHNNYPQMLRSPSLKRSRFHPARTDVQVSPRWSFIFMCVQNLRVKLHLDISSR
jgi:hypothetical protein